MLGMSIIELVLAERKYGVFRGGFLVVHYMETPQEIATVLLFGYLPSQIAFTVTIYLIIAKLFGKRWNGLTFPLTVGIVGGASMASLLLLRYDILAYFGDAISFDMVKRLAGGDIWDALAFVLSDVLPILAVIVLVFVVLVLVVRVLFRFDIPPAPDTYRIVQSTRRLYVATLLAIPIGIYLVDEVRDLRFALQRFIMPSAARAALSFLTDFDGDGYSLYSLQRDTNPFDSTRYPLALDNPNNGIDEDGFCGDFTNPTAPAVSPLISTETLLHPSHLIVIVLESTRGDVLGKHINGRIVAPNINKIAQSGSSAVAYSHVGYTVPTLKTLFTGQLEPTDESQSMFLDLKKAGYRIGVISGQAENFGGISNTIGMHKNSDVFIDGDTLKEHRAFSYAAKGSLLIDEAILFEKFKEHYGKVENWQAPNFVYLNFQSPHFPYHHDGMLDLVEPHPLPRSEIRPYNRDRLTPTYWNAVAWSDHWIGEIVTLLKSLNIWGNTLLVITGDHGESLFDDGLLGHGLKLDDQQTNVPFVLNKPDIPLAGAIGISDYRQIILSILSGKRVPNFEMPVVQFIGGIESASSIGIVTKEGKRTTLDTTTRVVTFDTQDGNLPIDQLHGAKLDMACQVVKAWENARWQRSLHVKPPG